MLVSVSVGRVTMIGGDVVVAYYDQAKNSFHAEDYYLLATMECQGKNGVCQDERLGGRDDAILITGTRRNGVTCVVYRRPVQTNEAINDQAVPVDMDALVIGAIGPLVDKYQPGAHNFYDVTKGRFCRVKNNTDPVARTRPVLDRFYHRGKERKTNMLQSSSPPPSEKDFSAIYILLYISSIASSLIAFWM